jgi:hypothetical protein
MKSKHPEAWPPSLPSDSSPEPVRFDEALVLKKVEGFPPDLLLERRGHGLNS